MFDKLSASFSFGAVKKRLGRPTDKTGKQQQGTQLRQRVLLQQLKDAPDQRTRQRIADALMGDDLLNGADLSSLSLSDIHLESANLENADFSHTELAEADLENANLQHADLSDADLTHADLLNANLCDAELTHIHLDGATLANANLSGACLQNACLRGASLYDADLAGAQLDNADLRGCVLLYANLQGASFEGARFDETTVLPDGELWKLTTDMRRYTDVAHNDYISYEANESPTFRDSSAG